MSVLPIGSTNICLFKPSSFVNVLKDFYKKLVISQKQKSNNNNTVIKFDL